MQLEDMLLVVCGKHADCVMRFHPPSNDSEVIADAKVVDG